MPYFNKTKDDQRSQTFVKKGVRIAHLTAHEISLKVDELISSDRSNIRSRVVELLYQFVALTEETLFHAIEAEIEISNRIDSFTRRLRDYQKDQLIASVPRDTLSRATRAGLPKPDAGKLNAYCLGPVGSAYAERKGWNQGRPIPETNHIQLAHDLICAEVMIKMSNDWLVHERPGLVEVRGPREVSVWDEENKRFIVMPDGLLIKNTLTGEFERAFIVEYQNVRARLQVQNKLKNYEAVADPKPDRNGNTLNWIWDDVWGVEEMPFVLVIHRQESTLKHYQDEIRKRGETNAQYAAISLNDIWAGNLSIRPIRP